MLRIIYMDDDRRPERNASFKEKIERLGYGNIIEVCETVDVDYIASLEIDGVICHSGMTGYDIVNHFAKKNNWPMMVYSGSVDSTPYLRQSGTGRPYFSIDSDYFEKVLPEFIERCQSIKREA